MKFLVDECLHTSLVDVALRRGREATHVRWRGLGGAPDWKLMKPIREANFTFVTNNAGDFRRLFAREKVHAGLVIVTPQVPPALQRVLFDAALDDLNGDASLVNEALEVKLIGDEIEITRYGLSPDDGVR